MHKGVAVEIYNKTIPGVEGCGGDEIDFRATVFLPPTRWSVTAAPTVDLLRVRGCVEMDDQQRRRRAGNLAVEDSTPVASFGRVSLNRSDISTDDRLSSE